MQLKKLCLSFVLIFLCLPMWAQQTARCVIQQVDKPEDLIRQAEIELHTQNWIRNIGAQATVREVITIPVVVHVIYFDETENISDLQIFSQLQVLNEDFRFLNEATDRIPQTFQDLAADVELEFCLVNVDPDGQATNGITRTQTTYECIGNTLKEPGLTPDGTPRLYYTDLGGRDIWDSQSYLNLYVANTCDGFIGRAKLPGTVSPNEDAPIIDNDHFGSNCTPTSFPFDLGRTATHEVGHFFNLIHIFGDADECDIDDLVSDTPLQKEPYTQCPSHPQVSCNSLDMFMNFMDYVDDRCMLMFTTGQKNRMLATLAPGGPRAGLATSSLCGVPAVPTEDALRIFPNPVGNCLYLDFETVATGTIDIRLYNAFGQLVYERKNSNTFALKSIDTTNLTDGVYWLVVEYGDDRISRKVIKTGAWN